MIGKGVKMILVNVDSLSESELRSIALQEGVDGADALTREEIISILEETIIQNSSHGFFLQ